MPFLRCSLLQPWSQGLLCIMLPSISFEVPFPFFRPLIEALAANRHLPSDWRHAERERWRLHTWRTLARDRPQDFSGTQHGVNRELSTSLLKSWTDETDRLPYLLDLGLTAEPDPSVDPRPRIKTLRQLLVGGLMDPERDHRHRRNIGTIKCRCGGVQSHHHIMWVCRHTQQLRAPALQVLAVPLGRLPLCFKRTTIVPANFHISKPAIHAVQHAMVNIWQAHIREWSEATDECTVQPPDPPPAPDLNQSNNREEPQRKGHVLRPTNEGGMFCVKCGKQTKLTKHVRLKMLNKTCANKDLPRD